MGLATPGLLTQLQDGAFNPLIGWHLNQSIPSIPFDHDLARFVLYGISVAMDCRRLDAGLHGDTCVKSVSGIVGSPA
jgi:hypothetical protein